MKRQEIEPLLPTVFQRTLRPGSPLVAILGVMEALHAPPEAALDRIEAYFNPYRTPDHFVPYLAGWVDLDRLLPPGAAGGRTEAPPSFPTGLGRLRELIAAAAFLSEWRGTAQGLLLFLQTATGAAKFEIREEVPGPGGRPRPFHISILALRETEPHRELIEQIIEMEKPAYVTYELHFRAPET